jgi:hypothetical protein
MSLSVIGHRRRPTTLTIDNAPTLNNRGIDQEKTGTSATVTGSLLQKPITVAAGNLGSCGMNPGKADTKDETAPSSKKTEATRKVGSIRGAPAQKSGRGIDKGDSRPAAEKMGKF